MEVIRGPLMLVFLTCYIFGHTFLSHNNGFVEAKNMLQDDLEIDEKLKTINKPAVKIIKTIHGDLYGCVDFFKQPAFDHPSMKNHTYHYTMRPTWKRTGQRKTNSSGFGYLWENGVGCPIGTVPIPRVTKYDLLRLKSLTDNHKPRGSWNTTTYDPNNVVHFDQHHYAVSRTKNTGIKYNGATMDVCITAPKVKPTQFSASRLHIQLGDDFLQLGITINPVLYKDYKPRTFVYTKAGGKSCYNTQCDVGMIIVRPDIPLGMPIKLISVRGDNHRNYYSIFGLIKDQASGNWWYEYGSTAEEVGFWPSNRFRQGSGDKVEWGGEVYSARLPSPQMGYGYLPSGKTFYDAYIKRLTILDGNYKVDREVREIEGFSDNTRGYQVFPILLTDDKNYARFMYYGGPGNI